MDFLQLAQEHKPQILAAFASIVVLLISIYYYYEYLTSDTEQPVDFSVPLPKQCEPGWAGEVLDEPAIKVVYDSFVKNNT